MSGVWLPPGKQTFLDPLTGEPMVGGLVYHWIPGTDTPKDTWEDEAQTSLNTNPIVLDGNGQCTIWGDGLYRQKLTSATGVEKWDQVTGFSGAGATVTFASPAQVVAGLSNDTVISPYALAASGVLNLPYASAAQVLAGVSTTTVVSPAALTNSGIIPTKASAGEVAALTNDTKFITPKALGDSGVLSGSGGNVPALTDYGWVGDNVTDNAPVLAAMLASTSWDMRVPTGTFYVSGSGPTVRAQLIKRFWGPGKFRFDDGYIVPGRYSNISAAPTPWGTTGVTGFWAGDTESVEAEWHVLGPTVRESLTAQYFQANTIPHPVWYDVGSGASGMLSRASGALVAGAGSATLISTDGITVGATIGVTPWGQDGAITDTIIIDTVIGNNITFHPNLTTNYPNVPPAGFVPGLATFMSGKRTWNGVYYAKVTAQAQAGGDVYGAIWRLSQSYVPKAGQIHVFNTSTAGLAGGDVNFLAGSTGTYATGWENSSTDQGNNVAYSAFVDSFNRTADTVERGVFWAGHVMQSAGGRPVDTGVVQRGFFRYGMDVSLATMEDSTTVALLGTGPTNTIRLTQVRNIWIGETVSLCDAAGVVQETKTVLSVNFATGDVVFTTNYAGAYPAGRRAVITHGGAAVQAALGQTVISFNASSSNTDRSGDTTGVFGPQYGNVPGDMALRSGNDGTSDFWAIQFNRASPNNSRLRGRPDGIQANVSFTSGGSLLATNDVVAGAFGKLGFGIGSGIYFFQSGGHIYATINDNASNLLIL